MAKGWGGDRAYVMDVGVDQEVFKVKEMIGGQLTLYSKG